MGLYRRTNESDPLEIASIPLISWKGIIRLTLEEPLESSSTNTHDNEHIGLLIAFKKPFTRGCTKMDHSPQASW